MATNKDELAELMELMERECWSIRCTADMDPDADDGAKCWILTGRSVGLTKADKPAIKGRTPIEALRAARDRLKQQEEARQPIAVAELKWNRSQGYPQADCILGVYSVSDEHWVLRQGHFSIESGDETDEDAAMAACQRNFNQRIRSVASVRKEG